MDYQKNRSRRCKKKERMRSEPLTEVKRISQTSRRYPAENCTDGDKTQPEEEYETSSSSSAPGSPISGITTDSSRPRKQRAHSYSGFSSISGKESEEYDVRKEGESSEIKRILSVDRLISFCGC
ncbi:hypothetical protein SRHO_G00194000 [Serrasalmus rhombeus]